MAKTPTNCANKKQHHLRPGADLFNNWSEQEILNEYVEVTYPVEVIYDVTTFSWEIITN
jgi:hypothetical protein|tara:strand:- start:262 stop:438 length:177 start_codon:yes stop_codon:yes gene_type:complete